MKKLPTKIVFLKQKVKIVVSGTGYVKGCRDCYPGLGDDYFGGHLGFSPETTGYGIWKLEVITVLYTRSIAIKNLFFCHKKTTFYDVYKKVMVLSVLLAAILDFLTFIA